MKEAAAALGGEKAAESSETRAYDPRASRRLIYPGEPERTAKGEAGVSFDQQQSKAEKRDAPEKGRDPSVT